MQNVAVTGNTSYTASGWVKTQGIAGGGNIVLEWRTAANAVIRTDVVGPCPSARWTGRSARRVHLPGERGIGRVQAANICRT